MLFCKQCDIALSLTLAAPISKCFRRPCSKLNKHTHGKPTQMLSAARWLRFVLFDAFVLIHFLSSHPHKNGIILFMLKPC